ncbi:MAG: hypothetical protein A2017_21565 [Lentisphaerae bacterium GWF2_44_16]|nr:MAG: hypothetical protein A2017_21565 [Lentisphaerae bacterium GWF2_44_16]
MFTVIKNSAFRNFLFTLVELLIVISIITVLCSLLLPALQKTREKAREISCASNMKQIGICLSMYTSDYNGFVPADYVDENSNSVYPQSLLNEYVNKNAIWRCPDDRGALLRFIRLYTGAPKLYISITYNAHSMYANSTSKYYIRHRMGDGHESKIIAFTDFIAQRVSSGIYAPQIQTDLLSPDYVPSLFLQFWRHNRRPNVLFFDGHTTNTRAIADSCQWPDGWRWNVKHRGCPSTAFND